MEIVLLVVMLEFKNVVSDPVLAAGTEYDAGTGIGIRLMGSWIKKHQ